MIQNLISCSDFVLAQSEKAPLEEYHQVNETFVNKVIAYATFLKEPLTINRFVPAVFECGKLKVYEDYHTFNSSDDKGTICKPYEGLFEIDANEKCKGRKYLCNEFGNVRYYDAVSYEKAKERYEKALEDVYFDNFHIIGNDEDFFEVELKGKNFWIVISDMQISVKSESVFEETIKTIEDLIPYNLPLSTSIKNRLGI